MRSAILLVSLAVGLAACANPVAQQAMVDTRHDPVRADSMLAVNFGPGGGSLSTAQVNELKEMVAVGRRAQRDEFVVVSDGSGGAIQRAYAERVGQSLSEAGARWVSTSVDPQMATGPHSVVIVRSEYLLANNLCPNYMPASQWNPNEAAMPGFGCADAYNMGQMLARPRDAAVGRSPGPADGTVTAAGIARYRDGKVRSLNTTGIIGAGDSGGGTGGAPGGTN
jgi:type IV pilus biogenesis protein CpaD/CtpE